MASILTKINPDTSKRNVVIVGGGAAGQSLGRKLSAKLDASEYSIILIELRPYRILLPPSLRMLVSNVGNLEEQILVPYDKNFIHRNGSALVGKVTSISKSVEGKSGHVTLESGEEVPFDVLILATGNTWRGPIAFPISAPDVSTFISESRQRFAKAQNIVLAGGGSVGIELAGEIKDIWPAKDVTIVHGAKLLANDAYPNKFRRALEHSVRSRGINLYMDDFLDEIPEYTGTSSIIKTRNGEEMIAGYVLDTRGPTPNTKFISESLGSDVLTSSGLVKVTNTLQLPSNPDIFAMGDIINWDEQKQVLKAIAHSDVVAANVVAYLAREPVTKEYTGCIEFIQVTNGKNAGAGYISILWGLLLPGWLVSYIKGKQLFVPETRALHGY